MRVKVKDVWYNGDEEPIMVEFTPQDKVNILNMDPAYSRYAQYPSSLDAKNMENWVHD